MINTPGEKQRSSPGVPYFLIRPIRQLRRSRACGGGWDVKNPLNTR